MSSGAVAAWAAADVVVVEVEVVEAAELGHVEVVAAVLR
jgi:hypothetical protein